MKYLVQVPVYDAAPRLAQYNGRNWLPQDQAERLAAALRNDAARRGRYCTVALIPQVRT